MSTFRAELVDEREAFRVDVFDVVPPLVLFTLSLQFFVEA